MIRTDLIRATRLRGWRYNTHQPRHQKSFETCATITLKKSSDLHVALIQEQVLAPLRAELSLVIQNLPVDTVYQRRRILQQRHPRLFRSTVALALIAREAGRHQVLRRSSPTARCRQN